MTKSFFPLGLRFCRKVLLLFLVCCSAFVEARSMTLQEDSFLLRGQVRNASAGVLRLAVCHPIHNQVFSIPLAEDGTFSQRLPVVGTQDVYLYLFDAVTCLTFPGDTLRLDWDAATRDFRLSGTNPVRSRELELEKMLYERFRQSQQEANAYYASLWLKANLPDSVLDCAANYVKNYVAVVDSFVAARGEVPHRTYLRQRAAFDMLNTMVFVGDPQLIQGLLGRLFNLPDSEPFFFGAPNFNPLQCSASADFMYNHITNYLDDATMVFGDQAGEVGQMLRAAAGVIPNDTVREWYLLRHFYAQMAVLNLSPLELRPAYRWMDGQIAIPFFRAEYEKMGQMLAKRLAPGDEAPDFTLKDLDGRELSLHSLRGKYVYLDFWNTGCAPCIAEFKHMPRLQADNEAFADSIVYLSVCIGQSEKGWKELCAKHAYEGIQLYAPNNQAEGIAAYGIQAFPSYWIIGSDGRIVSTNFPRPSSLIGHYGNETGYLSRYIRTEELRVAELLRRSQ